MMPLSGILWTVPVRICACWKNKGISFSIIRGSGGLHKMENRIITKHGINEELIELRFRMARLEDMKNGKIRAEQLPGDENEDRMYNLSLEFFLRLK
jgi:hypothetical protein